MPLHSLHGAAESCDLGLYDFTGILVTTFLYGIAYAVHMALAGYTLTIVLQRRMNTPHYRKHAAFIAALVVLGTINIVAYLAPLPACNRFWRDYDMVLKGRYAVKEFLNREDLEALGIHVTPSHLNDIFGKLYDEQQPDNYLDMPMGEHRRVQDAAALLISILVQCYLLYRCHLLLARRFLIGGLALLLTAVIGLGVYNVVLLYGDSALTPHVGDYYSIFPRVYWALALTFNLGANLLIIIRLLRLRAKVRSALGQDYGRVYTGLAAMLMESSLLYSIVLIIAYLTLPGSGGANSIFSPLVTQVEATASELIILRFALGRAMSKQDVATVTANRAHVNLNRNDTAETFESLQAQKALPKRVLPVWMPRVSRMEKRKMDSVETYSQFPSSVAAVLRSHA